MIALFGRIHSLQISNTKNHTKKWKTFNKICRLELNLLKKWVEKPNLYKKTQSHLRNRTMKWIQFGGIQNSFFSNIFYSTYFVLQIFHFHSGWRKPINLPQSRCQFSSRNREIFVLFTTFWCQILEWMVILDWWGSWILHFPHWHWCAWPSPFTYQNCAF